MNAGSEPNWDSDLFRLYNKRLSAESWQDDFVEDPNDNAAPGWHRESQGNAGGDDYSRALFGGPGADLFGSRYSDRPEVSRPPRDRDSRESGRPDGAHNRAQDGGSQDGSSHGGGPPSMPSISQPMASISQSMPSISSGSIPAIPAEGPWQGDELGDTGSLVRPYARTKGRTRTDYDLAIETLVSTSDRGRAQSTPATPEHRSICGLCLEARSVAEIAAHLRLPLGVVRVLIGDMAGLGLVLIHDSGMVVGDRPSMEFLERVLSGLRRL